MIEKFHPNQELKESLQEKLNHHFNRFDTLTIRDMTVNVMSRKSDVPSIEDVTYDKEQDVFYLVFDTSASQHEQKIIDKNLTLFLGPVGQTVGIKITNFSKILGATIEKEFETLKKENERLFFDWPASKRIVEKQKLGFFENVATDKEFFALAV